MRVSPPQNLFSLGSRQILFCGFLFVFATLREITPQVYSRLGQFHLHEVHVEVNKQPQVAYL